MQNIGLNENYAENFDKVRRNSWQNVVEEQSDKSYDPVEGPLPYLCNLVRSRSDQDFGFKLVVDKHKGPYVSNVDARSPAERCGLKPGHSFVAVNNIYVGNLGHKEITQLITDSGNDLSILVISEDGAKWYRTRNMEVPLQHGAVLDQRHSHGVRRTDSMSFISLDSSTPSTVPSKLAPAADSCLKFPWASRRVIMIVVIILGAFLAASICGSLIHRFQQNRSDIFNIRLNDAKDENAVHSFNLNLEESTPTFVLDSPRFSLKLRTVLHFDKKLLLHTIPENHWCYVTKLNDTNLPDEDTLEQGAKRAALKLRAIQFEEDWNYKYSFVEKNNFRKLPESCGPKYIYVETDLHRAGNKKHASFLLRLVHYCLNCIQCRRICLPNYGLAKDLSGINFLSILNQICFLFSNEL